MKRITYFLILILLFITNTYGNSHYIDGKLKDYVLDESKFELFIDSGKVETFSSISSKQFLPFQLPICSNEDHSYWIKFNLDFAPEDEEKWVIEIYENHINHLTAYIPWRDSTYREVRTGDSKKFKEREYQHINFVFDLNKEYAKGRPIYLKIKSRNPIWGISTHIRTNTYFTFYAVNEYFLLGVFYGILFIMCIYNLLFYFSTRERVYVYYSLYIASFALYAMLEDGIGFSYVWGDKPMFTQLFLMTSRLLLLLTYVIYSMSFLKLSELFPKLYRVVQIALFVFLINHILEKVFNYYNPAMYGMPFIVVYIVGIYTYMRGYKPARFFVAGSTFVVLSILTMLARNVGYTSEIFLINLIMVYATNIGITLEIIILSIALGDRIRYLKMQEEISREQIIEQLKVNQKLKDKVNLELEEKVRERTHELETKNKNIYDSLNYALRIQKAVLPSREAIAEVVPKNFVFHLSKDIVSGDFYWFHKKGDLIYVAAVDCTGHGVPGAFMSIMGSNLLHFVVTELNLSDPGTILDRMNFELKKRISSNPNDLEDQYGMDLALAVINESTFEVSFAGAFNPLVIASKKELNILKANRFPLGRSFYDIKGKSFDTHTAQLHKGDVLYLFSDGFKDQFGGKNGDRYTTTKFYELLKEISHLSMEDQKACVENELYNWKNQHEQIDDILVIGIKF